MSSQIINIKPQYTNYLIDEAKFKGDAESISFPINKNEILYILQELNHKKYSFNYSRRKKLVL